MGYEQAVRWLATACVWAAVPEAPAPKVRASGIYQGRRSSSAPVAVGCLPPPSAHTPCPRLPSSALSAASCTSQGSVPMASACVTTGFGPCLLVPPPPLPSPLPLLPSPLPSQGGCSGSLFLRQGSSALDQTRRHIAACMLLHSS